MTSPVYTLSNRQWKQVTDQGNTIRIAIPAPPWDCDPEEYFRDHVDIPPDWLIEAKFYGLAVDPRRRTDDPATLLGIVGALVRQPEDRGRLLIEVNTIQGILSDRRELRSRIPVQWAGGPIQE